MAGLSRSVWGLLQQLTSTDLQAGFRLLGRDVLDALRYLTFDRAVVLGGLEVTASAGGVSVAPGAILEPYPGSGSPPLADESPSVLGRLASALAVPIANPGVNTWYTIVARFVEADTYGGTSNVLNEVSGEFEATSLLMRREAALQLAALAGSTSALPAVPAGWVPLAGVLRRTSGPTLAGDIYDLRPLFQSYSPIRGASSLGALGEEHFEQQDYYVAAMTPTPSQIRVDVELIDRNGLRLSAHGAMSFASLLGPGVVPATSSWLYLYLSPFRGLAPKTALGRGLCVLTDVPTYAQGSRQNAAPINVLAPHAYTIAPGEATCVAALRTTSFDAQQLVPQSCNRGRHSLGRGDVFVGVVATLPPTFLPRNGRRAHCVVRPGGASLATPVLSSPSGFAVPLIEATYVASTNAMPDGSRFPMTALNLIGIDPLDIQLTGFPTGTELTLREVEL